MTNFMGSRHLASQFARISDATYRGGGGGGGGGGVGTV